MSSLAQPFYKHLGITPEQLSAFCQQWQIQELSLFGSVLRDDFRADSDIDVLVTFAVEARISLLDLVEIQYQLSELMRRDVDLLEKTVIANSPNWIRRQEILSSAILIYEQRQSLPV